jgi:hypothetical protein
LTNGGAAGVAIIQATNVLSQPLRWSNLTNSTVKLHGLFGGRHTTLENVMAQTRSPINEHELPSTATGTRALCFCLNLASFYGYGSHLVLAEFQGGDVLEISHCPWMMAMMTAEVIPGR